MDKSQIEKIREYYRTAKLYLPKFSNFRIFKFKIYDEIPEGKVIQIRDQVRDIETLRKHLVRWAPIAVWYSSGCFLNPSMVRGTKTKNILLFRNLVFDIDSEEPHNEEQIKLAKDATRNVILRVRDKLKLEPEYILFSGNGFQVVYKFSNLDNKAILDLNLSGIDKETTLDKYRVIRLPLTIHKSGRLAVFLTEKELDKPVSYILDKSHINSPGQNCWDRPEMRKQMTSISRAKLNGQATRSGHIVPALAIAKYITNKVNGTKRYVPILIYDKNQNVNIKRELENLYNKYQLNMWAIFNTNSCIIALNPYSFDKRRLEKILNSSRAEISKVQFNKYDKIFFRVSHILRGKEIEENPPQAMMMLNLGSISKKFLISSPHLEVLKHFGFPVDSYNNNIGYEKPIILEVHKR